MNTGRASEFLFRLLRAENDNSEQLGETGRFSSDLRQDAESSGGRCERAAIFDQRAVVEKAGSLGGAGPPDKILQKLKTSESQIHNLPLLNFSRASCFFLSLFFSST